MKSFVNDLLVLRTVAPDVGVVDAQDETTALAAREKDVVESCAGGAEMGEPGGARRDPDPNRLRHRHILRT